MKYESINQYQINEFFKHYFVPNSNDDWLFKYESPLLDYVKLNIPDYVDTVIIFGCASGRDFIPFEKHYKCYGFDIESGDKINWVCGTDNLHYYQCSIQDFCNNMDKFSNIDFSKSLVYTQGTLMYLNSQEQDIFVKTILDAGCKNLVIHEYPPEWLGYSIHDRFNPSKDILDLFERKHFRKEIDNQPTGFLIIDRKQ